MRCWIKIAATALLIGMLGVDIGLQVERYFGMPPPTATPAIALPITSPDGTKVTDWAQGVSAIVVALFTIMLWRTSKAQGSSLQEQSRHMAGQLAAFTAGERPYLFILSLSEITYTLDEYSDQPMQFATYDVVNYGKTPATIDTIQVGHSIGREQPERPDHADYHHPLLASQILASGEKREKISHSLYSIKWKEYYEDGPYYGYLREQEHPDSFTPILDEGENLFIWIIVKYHGVSSNDHFTSSCWRYNPDTRQFIQHGGDAFNSVR